MTHLVAMRINKSSVPSSGAAAAATRDVSVDERLRALERQNLRNRARVSKPF